GGWWGRYPRGNAGTDIRAVRSGRQDARGSARHGPRALHQPPARRSTRWPAGARPQHTRTRQPLLTPPAPGGVSMSLAPEVLRALGDPVIAVDSEGAVVVWTPAAERLLGYAGGEVLGRAMPEVGIRLDPLLLHDGPQGPVPLAARPAGTLDGVQPAPHRSHERYRTDDRLGGGLAEGRISAGRLVPLLSGRPL